MTLFVNGAVLRGGLLLGVCALALSSWISVLRGGFVPSGMSFKEAFFDNSYGFFSAQVEQDICSSPQAEELAPPPAELLESLDAVLLSNPAVAAVAQGKAGGLSAAQLSVHWVSRYAALSAEQRREVRESVRAAQEGEASLSVGLDISPELQAALRTYAACRSKEPRRLSAAQSDREQPVVSHESLERSSEAAATARSLQVLKTLGVKTQEFLPGRFLGDVERICRGAGVVGGDSASVSVCRPPFQTAVQLVPLRLSAWWKGVRWQYHFPEFVRKALTLFYPLNRQMHSLYRQDMNALLALWGPYLEIAPLVPFDFSCHPPIHYFATPIPETHWRDLQEGRVDAATLAETFAERRLPASTSGSDSPSPNFVSEKAFCREARETHFGFFTGAPRSKPVKIVDAVILGFDLDVLEVRMHELDAAVDFFVVCEAHHHTLGIFQKPLFFARNKRRFEKFAQKIVHLELPFNESLRLARECSRGLLADKDSCWELEFFQRDAMLHMLAQINAGVNSHGNPHIAPGFLGDSDLVMTGDVDEIVMGSRLLHLRFCEPVSQPQFGWVLVHHPGRVDAMALKDFAVQTGDSQTPTPHAIGPLMDTFVGARKSLGEKGVFFMRVRGSEEVRNWVGVQEYKTLRHLESQKEFRYDRHVFERHRVSKLSPQKYLHGGWHLSDSSFLPYLFSKVPSDDLKPGYEPWGLYAPLLRQRGEGVVSEEGGLVKAQLSAWTDFRDYRQVGSLCVPAKQVPEAYASLGLGSLPWLLRCNPERYPTWFQQPDPRYAAEPRCSFLFLGEEVTAKSLAEWVQLFRFIRDSFSASLEEPLEARLTAGAA